MSPEENMASVPKLTVSGDDPRNSVLPTFANFVGISHVGTEVQFEFVFLDLNELAQKIERMKASAGTEELEIRGKTVGKLVVPVSSFIQLKDHLLTMFQRIESLDEHQKEAATEREYGD
jgi:hypothetical protein